VVALFRAFYFIMKYTILINQYAGVTNNMNLDLIDLAIFDFIKDFANSQSCVKMQTPEGIYFWISHQLIIDEMPLLGIKTKQGIIKRIENLIQSQVLKKHPNCEMYSKTLYSFGKGYDLLLFNQHSFLVDTPKLSFTPPLNESLRPPLNESLGDNNNNNYNTIIDNSVQNEFFTQQQEDLSKKTLFRNSEIYKLVDLENSDYSNFEKLYQKDGFEKIDLSYYFHCVSDWSDQKVMKRTKQGWIATVRQFIRGDSEKNKLKLKPQFQQKSKSIDVESAVDYLKGYE